MAFIVPGTQEGNLEGACILGDNLQHLQRITDFNTLLAKANQSIATASDGNQLLKDFCELAVRYAHFDLAAVARPDKSGWFQFPVAAGAVSFMEGLRVCIDPERPEGRGSLARVWKDQQPFFIEDSLEHPILELWRERYRRFSFKSSAVLPIHRDGKIWGLFVLFHAKINAFDEDLKALLTELALDISGGLDHIDAQNLKDALLNNSVVGILMVEGRVIRKINLRMAQMLGRTPDELEGQSTRILYADEQEWQLAARAYDKFDIQKEVTLSSVRMAHKDDSILLADFSGVLLDANEGMSVWTIEDVSERESSRQRLQRLSDFNSLLSETNKIVARVNDEPEMLQALCELAIRRGHLRLAWVGRPDEEGWFYPVAAAGEVGYLEGIRVSLSEKIPEGRGPRGQAWRNQTPVFEDSFIKKPYTRPWAERAKAFGLGASASLPVYRGGNLWAVLSLFHGETDVFDADLQKVVVDLAHDIGHGLDLLDLTRREREASAFNEALFNSMTAGVHVVRYPERVFVEVNQGFLEILGIRYPEDIIGQATSTIYQTNEENLRMSALSQEVLLHGRASLRDLEVLRNDGQTVYLDVSGQRLGEEGAARPLIVWTSVDVTARHHLTEELARQALIDPLTGLPNRRAFTQEFEKTVTRARRHGRELALVMVDLDQFKEVNDTYGHETGDLVLEVVGKRLAEALRRTDFVARMGGDEFVLLVEGFGNRPDMNTILEKVGYAVREPIPLKNGKTIRLDLSAGVCLSSNLSSDDFNVLLRNSDLALYQSKAHKNDRVCFWTLFGEDPFRQKKDGQEVTD